MRDCANSAHGAPSHDASCNAHRVRSYNYNSALWVPKDPANVPSEVISAKARDALGADASDGVELRYRGNAPWLRPHYAPPMNVRPPGGKNLALRNENDCASVR